MTIELVAILALERVEDFRPSLHVPLRNSTFSHARTAALSLVLPLLATHDSIFEAREDSADLAGIEGAFLEEVGRTMSVEEWSQFEHWWNALSPRSNPYDSEWWWFNAIARISSRHPVDPAEIRLVERAAQLREAIYSDLRRVRDYSERLSSGKLSGVDGQLIEFFSPNGRRRTSTNPTGLLASLGNLLIVVGVSRWWTNLQGDLDEHAVKLTKQTIVETVLELSPPTRLCYAEPRSLECAETQIKRISH